MNINNSNPNIGYKNVDITIRNFHIHNEFHNHKIIINFWITIGQSYMKKKEKKKEKERTSPTNWFSEQEKKNHPLIKTPKDIYLH